MRDLAAFIRQYGPHMTLSDLAEEAGVSVYEIRKKCAELCITPPTGAEVRKTFIKDHPDMPLERMLKILDCNAIYFQKLCREMGIAIKLTSKGIKGADQVEKEREKRESVEEERKGEKEKGTKSSVASILASYKIHDDIHYPDHLLKKR